jgi:hypothetical protein
MVTLRDSPQAAGEIDEIATLGDQGASSSSFRANAETPRRALKRNCSRVLASATLWREVSKPSRHLETGTRGVVIRNSLNLGGLADWCDSRTGDCEATTRRCDSTGHTTGFRPADERPDPLALAVSEGRLAPWRVAQTTISTTANGQHPLRIHGHILWRRERNAVSRIR